MLFVIQMKGDRPEQDVDRIVDRGEGQRQNPVLPNGRGVHLPLRPGQPMGEL
uniref:Uncharacterized protein n=1 Tax=Anguilla anguilla TaxID=7936 RepID=A0A0E9RLY4_ANGAN